MEPIKDLSLLDPNKDYKLTKDGWVIYKDGGREKWYTTSKAAKKIGEKPYDIRNAIHRGSIVATKITSGSGIRHIFIISESSLMAYAEDRSIVQDMEIRKEYNRKQLEIIRKRRLKKIKHNAKWNYRIYSGGGTLVKEYSCSYCGFTHTVDADESINWKYCPMCGRKMEEE